jgi:hypothetical protein
VEATRREYEDRLEENNRQCAKREETIHEQEQAFAEAKKKWEAGEQARLHKEQERIAREETDRAATKFSLELNQKGQEIRHLEEVLRIRDEKLAEAQKVQAQFLTKERELNDFRNVNSTL